MERKELIKNKLKGLKVLAEKDLDPIFILTWRVLKQYKNGKMEVLWQPLFFSDTAHEMDNIEKKVILDWLEEYAKKEKLTLKHHEK